MATDAEGEQSSGSRWPRPGGASLLSAAVALSLQFKGIVRSIATLTMNPAIDQSTAVPYVLPDQKLRCRTPRYEPGGGGINVARAIRKLGGDALACFPVAGPGGALLKQLLEAEGVRQEPVPVSEWTRENLNVFEEVSGRQFRFCMPGPTLRDEEWGALLERVCQLRPAPDFLVASGSLPPGVPVDFYARLAARAREAGSRLVLDTSGEALARAVDQGVYPLKPSLREFQALTGERNLDEPALVRAAGTAIQRGWWRCSCFSLGAGGALENGDGVGATGGADGARSEQRGRRRQPGGGHRAVPGPGPSPARGRPLRGRRRGGRRHESRHGALPPRGCRAALPAGHRIETGHCLAGIGRGSRASRIRRSALSRLAQSLRSSARI
jgi:6-phosphofructokinase 2